MITAVFLRSNSIGPNLIAWGTRRDFQKNEDVPSHVGFIFEVDGVKTIIESDIKDGVHFSTEEELMKGNRLILKVKLNVTEEKTYRLLEKAKKKFVNKWYDFMGVAYFSWRILLFKGFGIPIPKKNKLQFKKMYFCSELYSMLVDCSHGMTDPNTLMLLLIDNPNLQCEIQNN